MPATTITITTIDVATAVAAEITTPVSGTEWLQLNATAERRWLPTYTDKQLAEAVQISVIPISEADERIGRKLVQREHAIELWMQKKTDPDPATRDAAVDDLASFAFQVKDYFMAAERTLSTLANVYLMKAEVQVAYNPKDLAERNLWVAVVKLKFSERTAQ